MASARAWLDGDGQPVIWVDDGMRLWRLEYLETGSATRLGDELVPGPTWMLTELTRDHDREMLGGSVFGVSDALDLQSFTEYVVEKIGLGAAREAWALIPGLLERRQ